MATTEIKSVTAEEYQLLPDPVDGNRLELLKGRVLSLPRPNWEQGEIAGTVGSLIKQFLKSNRVGRVSLSSGIITERDPDSLRGPDVSFISKERMPLDKRMNEYPKMTPDLCVEVLSPSNTRFELNAMMTEYFATGAKMVWVVDPDERSVAVYEQPDEGRVFKGRSSLSGGQVLPGFTCSVAEIFE